MFCSSCGKQIADDAVVCVGCGRSTRKASGSGEAWGVGSYDYHGYRHINHTFHRPCCWGNWPY